MFDLVGLVQQFLFLIAEYGYMSHLSAGLGLFFSIDMNEYIVHRQYFREALVNSFS